jgi:hypothetical protein
VQDNTKSRFIFRLILHLAPAHQILVMVLPKKIWKTPKKSPTTPSTCVQTKHTRNKFQLGNHVYVIASGGPMNSSFFPLFLLVLRQIRKLEETEKRHPSTRRKMKRIMCFFCFGKQDVHIKNKIQEVKTNQQHRPQQQ